MSLYSNASDFAKDTWLDTYTDQIAHSEGSLFDLLGLSTDERVKVEGRNTYMKIKVGNDLGFAMLTQGGDFGQPGDVVSDEATLELHRFSDTIEFDAHEMALLDSLAAGAAPVMATKMTASKDRVLNELERMAIMDGTGALAKVASVSGTTFNFDVTGAAYTERNPYTWVEDPGVGRYRIVDPTDGTDQLSSPSAFTFTSINESGNSAVASATLTGAAAGDLLVNDYGQTGFTSGGNFRSLEMKGLLAMIDDGNTYMGINRATAALAFWRSLVDDASGTNRDLTESLIDQFLNKLGRRATRRVLIPKDYCALTSPGVFTSYHNLMRNGIRYTISETPDIGWGGREHLPMNGIQLYKHQQAPRNQIMVVHKPSVKFIGPKHDTNSIVDWVTQGGDIFFKKNASSGPGYADAALAMIAGWIGMYTDRPRNHGRLDDITETSAAY